MLQTIHDKLKGIFAVTILVALGVVFVFWGIEVRVGSFGSAKGIEVNGHDVPVAEVQGNYRDQLSRYQAAFGAAGVPDDVRDALRTRVVDMAVRAELIRQRVRKLGFAASDEQVLEQLRQIPAFQAGGQFSADAYHAALRSAGMSADQFEAEQREYALARQLDRGLFNSAFVLPGEFDRQLALRQETRELAWVVVPGSAFLDSVSVDDAAVQAYYDANRERYMTEEEATVDYVEIDIAALAADVTIDEQALREFYEENKDRYTRPGRRHARHILIEAGSDPAAAEARAQAAYQRAKAGEDFAALARELSDDAGSRASGGDLGFAERGDFVAAFADAVWSMAPGEIRGPVRTEFGWHVIKLEAIDPETTRPFEDVRAELEPELRRNRVEDAFGKLQDQLDTLAFEAAGDLSAVAEKLDLTIKRVPHFTREGGAGLGATPELTDAVFSPNVLSGRELRTIELEPGRVVTIGVSAHSPAKPRPLEEIRGLIVNAARLERAQKMAAERAAATVAELKSGADWTSATRAWQKGGPGATQQARLVRRDDSQVPAEIRSAAFRAPAPQGGAQYGVAATAAGDTAIWAVTAVRPGTLAALSPDEQQAERDQARERAAQSDAGVYVTAMREAADVDVNPQLFE